MQKILFVPDSHHPFVNRRAWNLMLKAAKGFKPDHTVVLGDLLDLYSISYFDKDPSRKETLEEELEAGNKALDQLDALGGKGYFVAGNHEFRFDRYLMTNAAQLYSMMKLEKLLRLKERGWTFTPYQKALKIGKLWITHDEGNAGAQAHIRARSSFEGNVVIGHTHRMSVAYQGNARGSSHVGAMFGWLGDIEVVDYMHRVRAQQWQLGFGVGHMLPNGHVHLQPIPIVDNCCVVDGKLYKG